jgi:hypothetical protein
MDSRRNKMDSRRNKMDSRRNKMDSRRNKMDSRRNKMDEYTKTHVYVHRIITFLLKILHSIFFQA